MKRSNHYEAALEAFLRTRNQPYMAVDELRRSPVSPKEDGTIKNLDFVISVPENRSWLVDVKGRRFPSGSKRPVYWKQWSSWDDMVGMKHWENLFGDRFTGLFVFSYLICGNRSPLPYDSLFEFRKRQYAFIGIELSHYIGEARLISPKWRIFALPARRFRQLARPLEAFLQ